MTREDREKAIEILSADSIVSYSVEDILSARDMAIKALEREPRKGHWIDTEFMKLKECSICHTRWGIYSVEEFDFCPSCGADMREVEE